MTMCQTVKPSRKFLKIGMKTNFWSRSSNMTSDFQIDNSIINYLQQADTWSSFCQIIIKLFKNWYVDQIWVEKFKYGICFFLNSDIMPKQRHIQSRTPVSNTRPLIKLKINSQIRKDYDRVKNAKNVVLMFGSVWRFWRYFLSGSKYQIWLKY